MMDYNRQKYVDLMTRIEESEDRALGLENDLEAARAMAPDDVPVIEQELVALREQLAKDRNELSRLSDGCGKPHPM